MEVWGSLGAAPKAAILRGEKEPKTKATPANTYLWESEELPGHCWSVYPAAVQGSKEARPFTSRMNYSITSYLTRKNNFVNYASIKKLKRATHTPKTIFRVQPPPTQRKTKPLCGLLLSALLYSKTDLMAWSQNARFILHVSSV